MTTTNSGLESFVDHHRADFDAFEPRPDLWEDLAAALDQVPAAAPAPARVLPLFPAADLAAAPAAPAEPPMAAPVAAIASESATEVAAIRSARPYGMAAAVAALLLLATWAWQQQPQSGSWLRAHRPTAVASPPLAPQLPPYTVPELVSPASLGPEQRLAGAVQRMETYYAVQLTERQQRLRQADDEAGPDAPATDWQQELGALDEAYQQLKTELYRNPEPEVVLEAMNQNMQIRLDLLGQQLDTREQIRNYHTQPYMVADSRRTP